MRFRNIPVTSEKDATENFEQLQTLLTALEATVAQLVAKAQPKAPNG